MTIVWIIKLIEVLVRYVKEHNGIVDKEIDLALARKDALREQLDILRKDLGHMEERLEVMNKAQVDLVFEIADTQDDILALLTHDPELRVRTKNALAKISDPDILRREL